MTEVCVQPVTTHFPSPGGWLLAVLFQQLGDLSMLLARPVHSHLLSLLRREHPRRLRRRVAMPRVVLAGAREG